MHSPSILYPYASGISLRIRIADFVEKFASSLAIKLLNNITYEFGNKALEIKKQILIIDQLDSGEVQKMLKRTKASLPGLAKLDSLVSKVGDVEMLKNFTDYKKSVFKLEAKLNKAINLKNEIIPTPDYLKEGISNIGLNSIQSQLNRYNAI